VSGNSLPWLAWYHRDFLAATQGWTLLERGAYFMLLNASWEMGPLPADRNRLAGIIGSDSRELARVWRTVGPKFELRDGQLINLRLEEHRAFAVDKSEKARQAAQLRWRRVVPVLADADAQANGHPDASPSADADAS
jgi:uncharacterized protein YdaU (DUF1376 family)